MFKFLGLATLSPDLTSTAEAMATLLNERAGQGHSPPALATAYGFVITEWIEGTPLTPDSRRPELIETMGRYIARVAGRPLQAGEYRRAISRLAEMLYVNTHEALGEHAAQIIRSYPVPLQCAHEVYGDGHMQAHEWIDDKERRLVKVDGVGHDCDHSLIGKQSVVWDIAGAIVEWNLDDSMIEQLLRAFNAAGGTEIDSTVLNFYRAAYLAFRTGHCSLLAQMHDPYERDRLLSACAIYQKQLAELLGVEASTQAN